jgi:hypothetical protein
MNAKRDHLVGVAVLEMLVLHFLGKGQTYILDRHAELLVLIDASETQACICTGYLRRGTKVFVLSTKGFVLLVRTGCLATFGG